MSEYWKANKEIHEQLKTLIGQNHPDLATIVDEIPVVFREKAGKSGGQTILGSVKKVSSLFAPLIDGDYKFVLEVGADTWEDLRAHQKEALLDHLLTACRCEEDDESGELKLSIAKPDIMAFRENVERYGMWFPKEESDNNPAPIEQMFGQDGQEPE